MSLSISEIITDMKCMAKNKPKMAFFEERMNRFYEKVAMIHYIFVFTMLPFICFGIFFSILFSPLWFLAVGYACWMYYDWETPEKGGRSWAWYKKRNIWRRLANYFPLKLIKTVDLPTDRNYLFCYHPHGIVALGAIPIFATSGLDFEEQFPGISSHLATLDAQFRCPFRREVSLWMNAISCSAKSLSYVLSSPGGGNAVCLVTGGAEEALEAHPDDYRLYLKTRKGFVRVAIRNGASLVPVYAFGETSVFKQVSNPPGSRLRHWQEKFKRIAGFTPPLFYGRGMFQNFFGFMPFRTPINVVVGAPFQCKQNKEPSEEEVDLVHQEYLKRLENLFEEHKTNYGVPKDKHIEFY